MKIWLVGLLGLLMAQAVPLRACIWDSDTLWSEKLKNPDLAKLILEPAPPPTDPAPFLKRIQELKANPRRQDPHWWNDLAGAYIRAGKPQDAADLLAPVVSQFPDDYGIHANLGTAYHLLGRYAEAAKHIARDLEINPDAHFGLEKYHLALLQYLERDTDYQSRHVYVDEYSDVLMMTLVSFQVHGYRIPQPISEPQEKLPANFEEQRQWRINEINSLSKSDSGYEQVLLMHYEDFNDFDQSPDYRKKWSLLNDPKLQEGIVYMATLNPQQSAAWVMVGVLCLQKKDLNLAAAAFDKAIALGSPQKMFLEIKVKEIQRHIKEGGPKGRPLEVAYLIFIGLLLVGLGGYLLQRFKARKFPA